MKLLSVFIKNFAVLCVGELMLYTAGLIGVLGLCVFRHAISLHGFVCWEIGFFVLRLSTMSGQFLSVC